MTGSVRFPEPQRMNLMGYIMRDLLASNLSREEPGVHGTFVFDANGMRISVMISDDGVEIVQGARDGADARIRGDLNALLNVALGANYLKYVLTGQIKIAGDLRKLLKLLKVLRLAK